MARPSGRITGMVKNVVIEHPGVYVLLGVTRSLGHLFA